MLRIIDTLPVEIGSAVFSKIAFNTIASDILDNGRIYCIKNAIHADALDTIRNRMFDYYASVEQEKISYDALTSAKNYHSIEHGISAYQKSLHYFHAFVFNRLDLLPSVLKSEVEPLFATLSLLHNALTGDNRALGGLHQDGKRYRPQIFQYPCGGGMFASHIHPLLPQKIGVILGMSKSGRDYQEGGAGFEAPDGSIVDTSQIQDIGDIVLFRYDLKHWVYPCDICSPLDTKSALGRWSAVLPVF